MTAGKTFLAAMTALGLGASSGASTDHRGLRLEWQQAGGGVSLRVVTAGKRALRLRYALTVSGQSHSHNAGSVTVRPGEPAVVATVSIAPAHGWRAVMEVSGDQAYRVEAGS